MWGETDATATHRRFRLQLETRALRQLLQNEARLQQLRFDYDELRRLKRMLKNALLEEGVDLDLEVLRATDCHWDAEDEEKYAAEKRSKVGAPVGQQGGDDEKCVDEALPEPGDHAGLVGGRGELGGGAEALPDPDEVVALRRLRLAHVCKQDRFISPPPDSTRRGTPGAPGSG